MLSVPSAFDSLQLHDRVIIVTGAASGIGRKTAELLASRGAIVVAADLTLKGAEETCAVIEQSGGRAMGLRVNVAEEADVKGMIEATIGRFGKLSGAFNNAGVNSAGIRLAELGIHAWQRTIDINLTGVFLCLKYEIAHMVAHGGGAIVNTASGAGLVAASHMGDYVASKHGVIGLTKAASTDYAAAGVRVNAVAPGAIDTPMIKAAIQDPNFEAYMRTAYPIGRIGRATEVAEAAAWLLSDASSFVTGTTLSVDGGFSSV